MKIKILQTGLFIFMIFINIFSVLTQEPSWKLLPGSPIGGRFDDIYFINPYTGWAVGGSPASRVYKTNNGGYNWQLIYNFTGFYSRSICFIDSLTGFYGSLDGNQHLFRTTNGGLNWDSIPFPANRPEGICGLSFLVNTIMGSGTYAGFPKIALSTNRGITWSIINMDSYADALIDCYLVNETEAFVVGGAGSTYNNRKSVILYTSNSGSNWITRFTAPHTGNWGWKIDFPASMIGYVSLENNDPADTSFFAKTTNGGIDWEMKPYGFGIHFREQGIGFVNENTGWMGGYDLVYETTNGGNNWTAINIGNPFTSINRIRFYGDTVGYAGGTRIYKYTSDNSIGISNNQTIIPSKNSLEQNYPNPFNPVTVIKYEIFETSMSTISIFNAAGEEIYSFSNGYRTPGTREFTWYGTDNNGNLMPSGVYFYRLKTEKYTETKKMILVR